LGAAAAGLAGFIVCAGNPVEAVRSVNPHIQAARVRFIRKLSRYVKSTSKM